MDPMIYTIITHQTKFATYHELQTVYDVSDVYDIMEAIEANETEQAYREKMRALATQK